MPNFTIELYRVIDLKPDAKSVAEHLGLDTYPIFDEQYREGLNSKILNHYMFQEIGHETVEQFTFALKRKMVEIMPFYNKLYESTLLAFDPLSTIDIRTISSELSEQNSEGVNSNETSTDIDAKSKNVISNFPQLQLGGNKDYASNGADANSQTTTTADVNETSSATNTASNDGDSHTSGYQGSPALLLQQYRASLLNVDLLVINELDELFMFVWNNGDEYTRTKGRLYF